VCTLNFPIGLVDCIHGKNEILARGELSLGDSVVWGWDVDPTGSSTFFIIFFFFIKNSLLVCNPVGGL